MYTRIRYRLLLVKIFYLYILKYTQIYYNYIDPGYILLNRAYGTEILYIF